jgi:hypothetical protein
LDQVLADYARSGGTTPAGLWARLRRELEGVRAVGMTASGLRFDLGGRQVEVRLWPAGEDERPRTAPAEPVSDERLADWLERRLEEARRFWAETPEADAPNRLTVLRGSDPVLHSLAVAVRPAAVARRRPRFIGSGGGGGTAGTWHAVKV